MIYHLNAEFQRRARRDKKAFLSEQWKEIGEKNGKEQRSPQENQRYQVNISCKDGIIKDRNGMDQTEADDVARIH